MTSHHLLGLGLLRFGFFRLLVPLGLGAALALSGCSSDKKADDEDDEQAGSGGSSGTGGGSGGGSSGKGGSAGKGGGSSGGSSGKGGGSSGGSAGRGGTGTGGSAGAPPDIGDITPSADAAWTIFIYGHGDHNLSNSLLVNLKEIAQAELGEPGNVNVLVLTDWDASQAIPGTDPPEAFPEGVQLYRVPGGGVSLEVVGEGPEADLDDPDVLTSIVGDVFRAFPAERHGVVLWDHGGAWSGGFGSDTQNGTVATPTPMPVEAIPPALMAGLEAAGVDATPPLDFFAFDTCLMAGAEVAYPFRDVASVYIANAEIDYGPGWDYTATLTHIAENPDDSAIDLATAEVQAWDAHHAAASPNDALLRSHVAIDLTRIQDFADASEVFTTALTASATFDAIDLGRSGFFALPPYASQFENAGSSLPGLRDAGQLFDALGLTSSDREVASAANDARSTLDAMILGSSQGSLRETAGQAGVHVELSLASQITSEKAAEYADRASVWVGASGWQSVLTTLTKGADATAPTFTHTVVNGAGASQAAPPLLQIETPDADVAKAAVYLAAASDAQTLIMLGLVGTGTIEPATAYEFAWDGSVASFSDGQPAMLDIWLDSGSETAEPVLMVPGLLTGAAEEPLVTYLVFTPSEGAASVAVVSLGAVASTMSLEEIATAAPGATFSPLYYTVDLSTGGTALVPGDPIDLPTNGAFQFESQYAPAGDYVLISSLTDVWGNQGSELDACVLDEPLGN